MPVVALGERQEKEYPGPAVARLSESGFPAAPDSESRATISGRPLYEDDELVEGADGDGWDVRQVVYADLYTPDRGVVNQKAVNRTPAACMLKEDAAFLAAAPEMMKVVNDQAELLRQTREALNALWLHAGSVRKSNTDEWMEWMEGEVLPDVQAAIDELDKGRCRMPPDNPTLRCAIEKELC